METIGHHSCKKDGGAEYVKQHAPFISSKGADNNYPFLGEGYYFWDNNIERAHSWGKNHYKKKYYIVECGLNLTGKIFLDLVGNRGHIIEFLALYRALTTKYNNGENWPIGRFIEFLKKLDTKEEYKGIFPWKVIRAVDHLNVGHSKQNSLKFVDSRNNFTNLSPIIVICLYEKNEVILQSKILINQN